MTTHFAPRGPFDLLHQNQYFNGWPTLSSDEKKIVMAFPVEGWSGSSAVTMTQNSNSSLELNTYGSGNSGAAVTQALAAMSLDEDGTDWPKVGKGDEFVDMLQKKYQYMRPTLFHSPYESAASFLIGHRISMVQGRKIRTSMSEEFGEKIEVEGETFCAFPTPQELLKITSFTGLNETKIQRLHAVAQAALDGLLDRAHLRSLSDDDALTEIETLPGIGPFFSQGIFYRGAGSQDGITSDDLTLHGIRTAYELPEKTPKIEVLERAEAWRPFRMWVTVLTHVWLRETNNFPKRTFVKK